MTKLEFILGVAYNLKAGFGFLACIFSLVTIALTVAFFVSHCDDKDPPPENVKKIVRRSWLVFFLTTIILFIPAAIPSVDDLWRIRIGMIKLKLASPENVEKGAAEIIRIGKKLECRYLGCDEKKDETK